MHSLQTSKKNNQKDIIALKICKAHTKFSVTLCWALCWYDSKHMTHVFLSNPYDKGMNENYTIIVLGSVYLSMTLYGPYQQCYHRPFKLHSDIT